MVGGGAVVRLDVDQHTVVAGVPARAIRAVGSDELLERWSQPQRAQLRGIVPSLAAVQIT